MRWAEGEKLAEELRRGLTRPDPAELPGSEARHVRGGAAAGSEGAPAAAVGAGRRGPAEPVRAASAAASLRFHGEAGSGPPRLLCAC